MKMWTRYLTVNLIFGLSYFGPTSTIELNGPELDSMPAPITYFSNAVGLVLTCVGRGPPPLTISWLSETGEKLAQIPETRMQLPNGSLHFSPFSPHDYITTVHNGDYRCSVKNPVGTYLSPKFGVRAIVDHAFEVKISMIGVSSDMIMQGSPALLSCDIYPSIFSKFVRVIAWKTIDPFGHKMEIVGDDHRYKITADGSLLIYKTQFQQLLVCIGESSLNEMRRTSDEFMLTTQRGGVPANLNPVIIRKLKSEEDGENVMREKVGEITSLICLAVGSLSPTFRWEKYHKGKFVPVKSILHSSVVTEGPLLRIYHTNPFVHNGKYRCTVDNTMGTFTSDYNFLLETLPILLIEPKRKIARNGESFELNCGFQADISSEYGTHNSSRKDIELRWYKDGEALNRNQGHMKSGIQSVLQIFHATLDDQGVYQCFVDVVNSAGISQSFQASATVVFESSAPELVNTFISQSIQPGPLVSLKCSAVGNPIPRITWSIDNILISSQEQTYQYDQHYYSRISVASYQQRNGERVSHLNISNVQVEDSGVYKCGASNLVGNSSHSARLNIYGRIFVKEMSSLVLVADQNAFIPCHYGGYPVDKIKWLKGSSEFGTNSQTSELITTGSESRFTVFANGTLQIKKASRQKDSGLYTCEISNRKGETASGSVNLNIMRPPVISPIRFDEDLREGQRTSASCNVISGDLPIDIIWFKDFLPVPDWLNVTENRVKFLSVLMFDELYHEHSGEYTCSVSNSAATVTQSAILIVKVPPKWTIEPDDLKAIVESDHLISCSASGVPMPDIFWLRESTIGGKKYAIKTNDKFQLTQDGSLKILRVEETDASTYICEARNGVGNGISKSIRLDVIIPAKISAPMTPLVVVEGLRTTLKCEIRGDAPIQVSWKKDSILIESKQSPSRSAASSKSSRFVQHQRIVEGNSSVVSAELRIDPSEQTDSGLYLCLASNQYGRDEARINLEVKARPSPPENFMVKEISSRFIRLSWSLKPSDSLETPVTYFVLQWKKSLTVSWESLQVYNKSVESYFTSVVIDSLNPVTNYDVRLFTSNEFGLSLPTPVLTILTLAEAPSGSPTNVSGVPLGPKQAIIKWEPPDPALQNGEILGYQIFTDLNLGYNEPIIVDEKWELQKELKNLKPNSQYRISIRAYNRAGEGPTSPPIFIHTPEGAPDSPPLHLECEALSPKSLQVQWDPPPAHLSNGQILGYKVIYLPFHDEAKGEKGEVKKTSNRETTLHGLKSFTNYSIKALAYTLGGESNLSEPVICRTEEDFPEEPADLKVSLLSGTSALVSWLPPRHSNGIITKYTVFWKSEESEQIKEKSLLVSEAFTEGDEFFQEIRRLKDSNKYSVWVTASTNIGSGKGSHIESFQLSSKIPARIASFPAIRNMEIGQFLRLACRTVGIPLPNVLWFKNNLPLATQGLLRNGSLFISRVKDSDEGIYTCRAENEHGSDEIEHRIIIKRRPSAIPIFVGYVTDSSIQIHWDPPENIEPPLTAYFLQYQLKRMESGKLEEWKIIRLGPRLASYLLENLLCGSQYLIRILGENSVGKGEPSQHILVRTKGKEPELPKLTEVLDGNGTMIRIDLTRWSDGGCPIINFNIQYKREGSENWNRIYKKDNSTRVFVIQTQLFSKYEIKIRMENDGGTVTKVFRVESHPDFFTNYAKVLERVEKEVRMNGSYVSLYTDPHVLVPIVSALICTFAIAICALMLIKRKNQSQTEWKLKENKGTNNQKTWLSGSADGMSKFGVPEFSSQCPEPMSVYATLNSTQQIPMTIRDATVRFQSLGQHENNEAPPSEMMTGGYSKRNRRKSLASSALEESCMQQVACQMEIEPPTGFRSSASTTSISQRFHHRDNLGLHKAQNPACLDYDETIVKARFPVTPNGDVEEEEDGLFHDYSSPYQFLPGSSHNHGSNRNTFKNEFSSKSAKKLRVSRDSDDFF